MTWNHRVIHTVYKEIEEEGYSIHEVFYDEDGVPDMMTLDAVGVWGETMDEVQQTLEWMTKALEQPILEASDFDKGGKYYTDKEDLYE